MVTPSLRHMVPCIETSPLPKLWTRSWQPITGGLPKFIGFWLDWPYQGSFFGGRREVWDISTICIPDIPIYMCWYLESRSRIQKRILSVIWHYAWWMFETSETNAKLIIAHAAITTFTTTTTTATTTTTMHAIAYTSPKRPHFCSLQDHLTISHTNPNSVIWRCWSRCQLVYPMQRWPAFLLTRSSYHSARPLNPKRWDPPQCDRFG